MQRNHAQTALLPVGILLCFVVASAGRLLAFDVGVRAAVAHALWTKGSVFVPPGGPWDSGMISTAHGGTSFYGIGQSLVLIPFDALGHALETLVGGDFRVAELPIALLYVPLVGLLWWWSVSVWLRALGLTFSQTRWAASVFALTTSVFVYSSQSAQEEALVGTLVLLSLTLALRGGTWYLRWAGFLAGSALLVRLNSALSLLPLIGIFLDQFSKGTALLFSRWKSKAVPFGKGAAGPVLLLMFFAWLRFGSPFATGYDLARMQGLGVFWTSFQPAVFWGAFFGFGKGLFWLSPPLLFALAGWSAAWEKRPWLGRSIALCFILEALLTAFILNNPDGSECWANRYFIHLLPLLFYPAWIGWTRLKGTLRKMALALWVAGALIQAAAVAAPDSVEYIQSDSEGFPRIALLTSASHGQLGRRLENVFTWISGKTSPLAALSRMQEQYVPNVWGFSWAKRMPSLGWALGLQAVWWSLLLSALACLAYSLRVVATSSHEALHSKRRSPFYSFSRREAR